jgi:hypothetical protein
MEEVKPRSAGLAILRVWVEDGSRDVRARLTTVDDVSNRGRRAVRWTGTGTEHIVEELRSWLGEWEQTATNVSVH